MWELHTYAGGDFLRMIFNGIAAIFGNDSYSQAVAASAILGLMSVLISAAFRRGELNIQWLIAVVMLYQAALVPKTDIQIIDHVITNDSATVANIPVGIAAPATILSAFSYWSTQAMETVFSMPNELQYTDSGMLFANTLVEAASDFQISSPRIATNFYNFWRSCAYYDLLLNLYSMQELAQETDLLGFFASRSSVTRRFVYQDVAGTNSLLICREGMAAQMTTDFTQEVDNALRLHGSRLALNRGNTADVITQYAASMPIAFNYMTNLSQTSAQIIGQNTLANSFKRGLSTFASEIDASAAVQDFALAKAEEERQTTFTIMGKLAHRFLPILQHLFEAFIYAVSPIVLLLAMTPLVGKVILGYLKMLFWINLWPPLFAVLHFATTYYSARAGEAAMMQGSSDVDPGLSMLTYTGLGQVMGQYSAIAGYLSVSIPMIAWMMVSMSGAMMAGLAGRFLQGYETPVSSAADDASSGNLSIGNNSYMNNKAFSANTSPMLDAGIASERTTQGSLVQYDDRGATIQQVQNSSGIDVDFVDSMRQTAQKSSETAEQHMQEASTNRATTSLQSLREATAVTAQMSNSQGYSNSYENDGGVTETMATSDVESELERWAQSRGVDNIEQHKKDIIASIFGGANAGGGVAKLGMSAQYSESSSSTESQSESQRLAQEFSESTEFAALTNTYAKNTFEQASQYKGSLDQSTTESLNRTIDNQNQSMQSYSNAFSKSQRASEQLQSATEASTIIKTNGSAAFVDAILQDMDVKEADQLMLNAQRADSIGQDARAKVSGFINSVSNNIQSPNEKSLSDLNASSDLGPEYFKLFESSSNVGAQIESDGSYSLPGRVDVESAQDIERKMINIEANNRQRTQLITDTVTDQ